MPRSRVIRDQHARLDPPTLPVRVGLDDPDASTPLFGALWAMHGMGGRHALTPTRTVPLEAAVNDHPDSGLVSYDPDDPHDPAMPSPDQVPARERHGDFERPDPAPGPATPDIAVCPTCGTAVSRGRLR